MNNNIFYSAFFDPQINYFLKNCLLVIDNEYLIIKMNNLAQIQLYPQEQAMKVQYFPGKLIVLTNEYFNKQKQIKTEGNSIQHWKDYVERFFSENCNYCIIMSRVSKEWTFSKNNLHNNIFILDVVLFFNINFLNLF